MEFLDMYLTSYIIIRIAKFPKKSKSHPIKFPLNPLEYYVNYLCTIYIATYMICTYVSVDTDSYLI